MLQFQSLMLQQPQLEKVTAIILAAGKATRMRSALPKVLHKIAGLEIICHSLAIAKAAGVDRMVLVTAPEHDDIRATADMMVGKMEEASSSVSRGVHHAIQKNQEGTGSAVRAAMAHIGDAKRVVIMFGDTPLMRPSVISTLARDKADLTISGFRQANPSGYGRILVRDHTPIAIIEDKDADEAIRKIDLCNGGAMALKAAILPALLAQLSKDNAQKEYYLSDGVALSIKDGYSTGLIEVFATDAMGVDSRTGLARAEALIQERLRAKMLKAGVTMEAPETVFLSYDSFIAADAYLEPYIKLGQGVAISSGVTIKAFSHLEGVKIGENAQIGPFARLRPGSEIGADVRIGNFVETKNAHLEAEAKVSHLSYIGDAHIGARANIGAGTITCNYDGQEKHKTEIGADAFIGSNSALIAPISIGEGAYLGSGSTVSKDVEGGSLVVTRPKRREIAGWAAARKKNAATTKPPKSK